MSRAISAEESTIAKESQSPPKKKTGEIKETLRTKSVNAQEEHYECPICLSWLKDPVLTRCGHHFCKICLEEWRKKNNTKCPLDELDLSIEDIFPDNFTKREIEQIRKSFPEQFDPPISTILECRFSTISCDFKNSDPKEIEKHMTSSYKQHIDLLLTSYLKTHYQSWDPAEKLPSQFDKRDEFFQQQSSTQDLLHAMYERIVLLEQQHREMTVKIDKLQLMDNRRHGCLIWKIDNFRQKIDVMKANPQTMFYSSEAYTDPNGYKFCARINLSQKMKDYISFHIHLMKSENDYHLSWPFIGRIKISMINNDPSHSQHDILMSKPEILAFHRPREEISPRGFGFTEYALITSILKNGFIEEECLTIKIQMNIV